jgi:hypothetical protein
LLFFVSTGNRFGCYYVLDLRVGSIGAGAYDLHFTIGLIVTMWFQALEYALRIFNYFFTAVFIVESIMKLVALGLKLYFKDR